MSSVRTRFAPSPTGSLHVGNARTAILNWLIARHHGGDFILRIEDTDAGRNVAGAEARLMADLQWLGLDWDEGPDPHGGAERGDRGPYHQSQRREVYDRHARRLLDAGAAYRCFCSPETLEAGRTQALAEGRSPGYPGTCRSVDPGAATDRAAAVRSDGVPTYNFAVVVDDAEMGITHVVRGAGHLSNTPHQLLLYRALGVRPPAFAHAPTVLGDDRSKLSKRTGARPLQALAAEGFHPDGVLNYLSLLGWSSPSEDEVLPRDRLIREISLERINAGDVVFDPDKMRWLSGQHIARMSLDELAAAVRPHVVDSRYASLLEGPFLVALDAVRSHLDTFGEVTDHLAPFLGPDPHDDSRFDDAQRTTLRAVRDALTSLEAWTAEAVQAAMGEAGKAAGARGRALYEPVRRAVTGEEHGPPLAAVLVVQGRQAALAHLARALGASPADV